MRSKVTRNIILICCLALLSVGALAAVYITREISPAPPDRPWLGPPDIDPTYKIACGPTLSGAINGDAGPQPQPSATPDAAALAAYAMYRQPDPLPENPVAFQCHYGAVIVHVATPRHFANRIGDIVPVTIWIQHSPYVCFDWGSVERGVLTLDESSDFDRVGSLSRTTRLFVSQGLLWKVSVIQAELQSFKPGGEQLTFKLDLRYFDAHDASCQPNNTTVWKRLRSPDLYISTIPTADNGTEIRALPAASVAVPTNWLVMACFALAVLLALPLPLSVIAWLLKRLAPKRLLSPEEKLWLQLQPLLFATRINHDQARTIAALVRAYAGCPAGTISDVLQRYHGPDGRALAELLELCEELLYSSADELSVDKSSRLASLLNRAIPNTAWDPRK